MIATISPGNQGLFTVSELAIPLSPIVDAAPPAGLADLTYVAVTGGFVYVAIILDACSRRVVGYALDRSIDAHLTIAAIHRRPD